jgi:hypothetical protein
VLLSLLQPGHSTAAQVEAYHQLVLLQLLADRCCLE